MDKTKLIVYLSNFQGRVKSHFDVVDKGYINLYTTMTASWTYLDCMLSKGPVIAFLPLSLSGPIRFFSIYCDMSSLRGKEKCVLTFSFSMVTMLNVYLIVLKHNILGNLLKQALKKMMQNMKLTINLPMQKKALYKLPWKKKHSCNWIYLGYINFKHKSHEKMQVEKYLNKKYITVLLGATFHWKQFLK